MSSLNVIVNTQLINSRFMMQSKKKKARRGIVWFERSLHVFKEVHPSSPLDTLSSRGPSDKDELIYL